VSTRHPDLFWALSAPFGPNEVKTRPGGSGRTLSYITSRQAANRLDTVCGPENWRNSFREVTFSDGTEAIVCTIEIKVDGEWVPKADAGGFKVMTEKNRQGETVEDEENTVKTGYSDAFKRAAQMWGVARYLYNDGVPHYGPAPPPVSLPEPPRQEPRRPPQRAPQRDQPAGGGPPAWHDQYGRPKSAKAMFAWAKEHDLLRLVAGLGKEICGDGRIMEWDEDTVRQVVETIDRDREDAPIEV
jgi:hypothetical protein